MRRSILAFCLGLAWGGCSPPQTPPDWDAVFKAAEAKRWDEVRAACKDGLQREPRSVAGHYLYARACLAEKDPAFGIAEGEIGLSMRLARTGGALGPFAELKDEKRYRARLLAHLARMHLRWADSGAAAGAPPAFTRAHCVQAREYAQQALSLDAQEPSAGEAGATAMKRLAALDQMM